MALRSASAKRPAQAAFLADWRYSLGEDFESRLRTMRFAGSPVRT
jgi:hypothetical protein